MPDPKSEKPAKAPEPGLRCPNCEEPQVVALPGNGIAPNPGYRCLSCDTRMRGMTGTFIMAIVIALALTVVSLGIVNVFHDERDASLRGILSLWLIPIYLIVIAYSVRELLRPTPRRIRR